MSIYFIRVPFFLSNLDFTSLFKTFLLQSKKNEMIN